MSNIMFNNFAFGSNMSKARLLERLPNVEEIGVATLRGYSLAFSMLSLDGSAKCNIHYTGDSEDEVLGVVYQLSEDEQNQLDIIEGERYNRTKIKVQLLTGENVNAFCYIANTLVDQELPFDWYVHHVYVGAVEHRLPAHYIERIKCTPSQCDTQALRADKEWSVHQRK